ncbi:MAG: zf-TFIIB domain-containing protein [Deltaproteobacteria bacterium]|jgi:Zn-finger nucleic acid-binding protein|nr:zf-TFIIB domain-containing protein [Deltaproteobacteria bacterium]
MKCPKCKEQKLQTNKLENIEINECPSCNGMFFEKDELRKSKDAIDPDLNWMDFSIWKHKDKFKTNSDAITCPKCQKQMVAIEYANTKIEVDFCPSCLSTWLDGGEFGKIIYALEKELKTMSSKDYMKNSLKQAKELITGDEKFMSEWKDLSNVLRLMTYRIFTENKTVRNTVDAIKTTPIK